MSNIALTDARVKSLKPRHPAFDMRDAKLRAFGLRVLPSGGKRFFIHTQHRGERVWRMVGDANAVNVAEARTRAASMLADIKHGANAPASAETTRFETVAEAVFRRYARVWKPRTLEVNRTYLRQQILPWFAGRPISDIRRHDVQRWFASLRATPAAADRAAPVLSVVMKEAELMGHRPEGSNPCRRIRRYRRKGRERSLSDDELQRLGASLSIHEREWPSHVAALRLLLLTGCRKGEVLTLRWSDYREGHLFLRDSKSGPRTVWLSRAARDVLDRIPRSGGWVFPADDARRPRGRHWLNWLWQREMPVSDWRNTQAGLLPATTPAQSQIATRVEAMRAFSDAFWQTMSVDVSSACRDIVNDTMHTMHTIRGTGIPRSKRGSPRRQVHEGALHDTRGIRGAEHRMSSVPWDRAKKLANLPRGVKGTWREANGTRTMARAWTGKGSGSTSRGKGSGSER